MALNRASTHHICAECRRQCIADYDAPKADSEAVKQHCLKLDVHGLGFRAIERVTGVNHPTVIYWVKTLGTQLADAPTTSEIPQVGEQGCT